MTSTRREFLTTAAAAPLAPLLLGVQDKAGTQAPVLGQGAYTYEAIHDWGELPPQLKWGNTHGVVEDSQGHIYVHHTVHATSDSADTDGRVRQSTGKFVRSWGKEFRGVAHGLQLRKEGRDEFLYLTVNAANPKMTPQPEMQAVVVKTTLKGEVVWKIQGPPRRRRLQAGRRRRTPGATTRPTSRSRRTATSTSATATARLHQSVQQQGRVHPHLRRPRRGSRASSPSRTASGSTRAARRPSLVVADRRNNRLQRFTLDGKHVDFIPGFRLPCHFDERKGIVVIPDLHGRVTLHRPAERDRRSTWAIRTRRTGTIRCAREPREKFIPGQFICPHGACFDHDGNIFVVEWVEVGRVTKLRKVS